MRGTFLLPFGHGLRDGKIAEARSGRHHRKRVVLIAVRTLHLPVRGHG